ncbi:MAG: phosphoribosylformylglycinamidine cyclo-ligase [Bdellovibrionia bacterium]
MPKIDYKAAGVDVEAGDSLVDWLTSQKKSSTPWDNRVRSGIGGFASLFDISFPEMKNPQLITCTDGVGTKVQVASYFQDFSTVGQDLVSMCVNDLLCSGGVPLQFLDYYATGKLNLNHAKEFLGGVRRACDEVQCILIGGETAEMPGVYQNDDFDCAGFAVGIVDRDKMWGAHRVQVGDCLIGLSSSGFHSNGFSLLRKVFAADLDQYRQWLLEPTRLYFKAVQKVGDLDIRAAANITGGGIYNIPRVIPQDMAVVLNLWTFPEPFLEVQRRSGLSFLEMVSTLNCGLGFVLIVPPEQASLVHERLREIGQETWDLGVVVQNTPQIQEQISWSKEV